MSHQVNTTERETVGRGHRQRWWIPSIVSFNQLIWLAVLARTALYVSYREGFQSRLPSYLPYWLPSFSILIIFFHEHLRGVRFNKYWVIIGRRIIGAFFLTPGCFWLVSGATMPWYGQPMMFFGSLMIFIGLYFVHGRTDAAYAAARAEKWSDSTKP